MQNARTNTDSDRIAYMIAAIFAVLAVIMFMGPCPGEVPAAPMTEVDLSQIDPGPRRGMQSDPPVVHLGAYDRDCMDCHQLFKTPRPRNQGMFQHGDIRFDHGLNDQCLQCHAREDRNFLVVTEGDRRRLLPFTQSSEMCSKCHGPTYRDWEMGIHGKATGSWDTKSAARGKLSCVNCHDPHAPAYPKFKPMPAPNTLRMGDQTAPAHASDSPLMKYQHHQPHSGADGPEHGDAHRASPSGHADDNDNDSDSDNSEPNGGGESDHRGAH